MHTHSRPATPATTHHAAHPRHHPGHGSRSTPLTRAVAGGLTAAALLTATLPAPVRAASRTTVRLSPTSGCGTPSLASRADLASIAAQGIPATVLAYPRAARPLLRDLASHLTPDPCDRVNGRFDLVHHRRWHRNPTSGLEVRDIIRWYDHNGYGAALTTQHPPTGVDTVRDHWTALDPFDPQLADAFSDTTHLQWHIASAPGSSEEAEAALIGLAVLSTWHSPRRPGRALALTTLADTPDLTTYPRVADRAGRAGIGVATTSTDQSQRRLLILHPTTGTVLAYEHATLTPTGWQVNDYLLLHTHTRTARRWWEPPTTNSHATARPAQQTPRPRSRWIVPTAQPCLPTEASPR
ncbi:hypothetical protein ACIG87_20610 [Micromonospora sp. NPDC051925]|uniref:hypothetical protein n=1 Tax=Micromonospora sp. NPDC051925 TaxID=3364288 RepID=UPI0037C67631